MPLTDPETVAELQSMAPGASQNDLDKVTRLMREGRIFRGIQDARKREHILENLGSIQHLIPTIYSLRQDLIYIRPCAMIMRKLFMIPERRGRYTVREAAEHAFSGVNQTDGQVTLQTSESSFQLSPGSLSDQIEVGYRQLYIYAMRFVLDMVPERAKKEDGEDTPQPRKPNPGLWRGIGALAYRLGFESEEIHRLRGRDADREIASDALQLARDPRRYKYPPGLIDNFISQMADMFKTAVEISNISSTPSPFTDGPGEEITRRCGRLRGTASEDSQLLLFFNHLNKTDKGKGKGLTSSFVRWSVYIAFFGIVELPSHKPAATPQDRERSDQEVPSGGQADENSNQKSATDGQDSDINSSKVTTSQNPTNSLKRGAENEQPFQFQFVFERPEMYPVETDRGKRIILSEEPNTVNDRKSSGKVNRTNPGLRTSVGASQDHQPQAQTLAIASPPSITPPSQPENPIHPQVRPRTQQVEKS